MKLRKCVSGKLHPGGPSGQALSPLLFPSDISSCYLQKVSDGSAAIEALFMGFCCFCGSLSHAAYSRQLLLVQEEPGSSGQEVQSWRTVDKLTSIMVERWRL